MHSSHAEQLGFDLRGEDRIVRSFHGSNLIGRRHAQVENERLNVPRADGRGAAAARCHKRLPGRVARLVRVAVLDVDRNERVADRANAMSSDLELGLGRIKQLKLGQLPGYVACASEHFALRQYILTLSGLVADVADIAASREVARGDQARLRNGRARSTIRAP